ncbi:MAG: DsbA family oxidoreductase [Ilumatobacteraceae bacterium]
MAPSAPTAVRPQLTVEIWSDVICPWCYIGKRRFEGAIEQVRDEIDVNVVYRPYQLDPTASSTNPMPAVEAYARKFGGYEQAERIIDKITGVAAGDGIEFHMERAVRANTLDAHRLLWLATATGHQVALKQRLLEAYFTDGLNVGDHGVLADCAADVGMVREGVLAFLDSDDGVLEVRHELELAKELGITAVPTFVFNGSWGVPGAQDADTFAIVLRRLAAKQVAAAADAAAEAAAIAPATPAGSVGECADGSCDV